MHSPRRLALPRSLAARHVAARSAQAVHADLAAHARLADGDATGSTATARFAASAGGLGEATFQSSGTVIEFPGFMRVTGERGGSGKKGEESASLPPLAESAELPAKSVLGRRP